MKNRLIQFVFFLPCCFIDGVTLFLINVPVWIITGVSPITSKESYLEWLWELDKNCKTKH